MNAQLYIGGPIWAYKGWVGIFYPENTKSTDYLKEYTRRLTTVEGNTTFYAVPNQVTLQSWAAEMPEYFRFCPKLPRTISHAGNLEPRIEQATQFLEVMTQLGDRLGPVFLQLPPRYSPNNFSDLEIFLKSWPKWHPLAVEVRHLDWFNSPYHENLNDLLGEYDMARVVIDTRPIRNLKGDQILKGTVYERLLAARERKPNLPVFPVKTASFTFLRYIGHPKMEQNVPFFEEWSECLSAWLHEGSDAYIFCHCPDERLDPWICREFYARISQRFSLPALPWDEADANTARQARLF
jgi:uncharacterized protein YecE (DUF72 family)